MENRDKVKRAFAEAIVQSMWVKGLITFKERNKITQNIEKNMQKSCC